MSSASEDVQLQQIDTDRVIIVGAGLAALYAALHLAPRPVLILSPEKLGQGASSAWAQGGVAAAMDPKDSAEDHATDTERAGAGMVDVAVADHVARAARDHILDLTELGAPFDRSSSGEYVLSREAAHSFARIVRVKGDQAGAEIMRAMILRVRDTPSIQVIEGVMAIRLELSEKVATGVVIQKSDAQGSAPVNIRSRAVLLAGGGSAGLYAKTTNPARICGQVTGMAALAGAEIADAEFVQFHPTAIDVAEDPTPLATESLRGEGAVLINKDGERFMVDVHPDAELAPRDVVARAVFSQSQAGKRPALDTRVALGARILSDFPTVAASCLRNGVDPVTETIPVTAAAHYHMGGVATDLSGRASLGNLWVCGETASTGLHGANRLASNGLLEALVFARNCALEISKDTQAGLAQEEIEIVFQSGGSPIDAGAVQKLRNIMSDYVGVVRDAKGLRFALLNIRALAKSNEKSDAFQNMCATATLIASAALMRQESRGAHMRADFPKAASGPSKRRRLTLDEALQYISKEVEPNQ